MTGAWYRKGLFYRAKLAMYSGRSHVYVGTYETKMFFVTWHLIKWIHGKQKLDSMPRQGAFRALRAGGLDGA